MESNWNKLDGTQLHFVSLIECFECKHEWILERGLFVLHHKEIFDWLGKGLADEWVGILMKSIQKFKKKLEKLSFYFYFYSYFDFHILWAVLFLIF